MRGGKIVVFVLLAWMMLTYSAEAQDSAPGPDSARDTRLVEQIRDQERRLFELETTQAQLIESLRASNDHNRFLITMIGAIIAILVAIQGYSTYVQFRRERQRFEIQIDRERHRDEIEDSGLAKVSAIMGVIQGTLESRFDGEKAWRERAQSAQDQLKEFTKIIGDLQGFRDGFMQSLNKRWREAEDEAAKLSEIGRHGFRDKTTELKRFADSFDQLMKDPSILDEDYPTGRSKYIRGIAGHYGNEPKIARDHLVEAIKNPQMGDGETDITLNARVSTAYYYLGLIESNFGNSSTAIKYFDVADRQEYNANDFLTHIVTAESHSLAGDYEKAILILEGILKAVAKKEKEGTGLPHSYVRLRSRANLMMANFRIIQSSGEWRTESLRIVQQIHQEDPSFYYATTVLAQITKDPDEAQKLFREAYEVLERRGDILKVTEVRIRILVLMVAGLCCRKGSDETTRSDEYLDEATSLLSKLPALEGKTCTVFSALSLKNEKHDLIRKHIDLIREGHTLDGQEARRL